MQTATSRSLGSMMRCAIGGTMHAWRFAISRSMKPASATKRERRCSTARRETRRSRGCGRRLPSKAMAKVSCRLGPDQSPEEVGRLMEAHVGRVAPKGVTVKIERLNSGRPWRAELDGPLFDAARRALAAAFGREPVIVGEGGSIPVVGDFQRILGTPVLLMGFGLPGENAHAPNEWISDENFVKGAKAVAAFWDELVAV